MYEGHRPQIRDACPPPPMDRRVIPDTEGKGVTRLQMAVSLTENYMTILNEKARQRACCGL